jgi:L-malate glycosyltransferase
VPFSQFTKTVPAKKTACKVPCRGGVPKPIDDGITGPFVAVGDIESIVQEALPMLSNPARLCAVWDATRKTARIRFCASLVVPQYVRYYESILKAS